MSKRNKLRRVSVREWGQSIQDDYPNVDENARAPSYSEYLHSLEYDGALEKSDG